MSFVNMPNENIYGFTFDIYVREGWSFKHEQDL